MGKKSLKFPNGYGSVVKQSNASHRRTPYIVRITTGYDINEKTGKTKQHRAIIGYATTREEGLAMLAKYHEQPYDLDKGDPTFREVYEAWSKIKYDGATNSTINGYRAAYNCCTSIFEKSFRDLKTHDLQLVIETCGRNAPTLRKIKILFNQLYSYALKNDICFKDYSDYIDMTKANNKVGYTLKREVFPKNYIDIFWDMAKDDMYYQMIIILIYTGVRIMELLDLKKENVNLSEQYFNVIESKTKAGIRKVPIGTNILPFFTNWYNSSKIDYVFHTPDQQPFKYRNYYDSYFCAIMDKYGLKQTPHCCRHTCVSLLTEAGVSPTYIKLIVGHEGAMNTTEKFYTHIDTKELVKAIDAMYFPST